MTELGALPTPSLLLDRPRAERNAARIGERVRTLGARLRPHIKTHKCIEVARLQTAGHGGGITVSTLAEARAFAAHGFRDITYAVPIEPGKFAAVVALVASGVRLALITDDAGVPGPLAEAARRAGVTLEVFIKVDCGYHRCGVDPKGHALVELAQRIGERSSLRFAGILTHAGHSYHARGAAAIAAVAREERDVMCAAAARLRAAGIEVPAVSVGSTPTAVHVDHLRGVDEVRAGNYVFFDLTQAALGNCTPDDTVLSVLASVVHRDLARRQVVLDAGAIAMSKDRGPVEFVPDAGYGRLVDLDGTDLGLTLTALSQEHGVVRAADDTQLAALAALTVGTRVRIRVNHSCLTAAQHGEYVVHDGRAVVDRWAIHRGW
ncbi:MAG: alanine racemase [Gemmatimonadales bacterium]|nr:alanine racemase [Gemmatimonadales bacterium]